VPEKKLHLFFAFLSEAELQLGLGRGVLESSFSFEHVSQVLQMNIL
jgi:hypothetical protein